MGVKRVDVGGPPPADQHARVPSRFRHLSHLPVVSDMLRLGQQLAQSLWPRQARAGLAGRSQDRMAEPLAGEQGQFDVQTVLGDGMP